MRIKYVISSNCLKDVKESVVNGSLRQCDSKDNVKQYKAKFVVKSFTPKEGITYKETFSSLSKNSSLRIIMALMSHYDLELHEMDVKMTFLNRSLD